MDVETQQLILAQFLLLDRDHSGFIDRADLHAAISQMPHTSEDAIGHLDILLDNLDVEKLGKVSFDSWTVFKISRVLTMHDQPLHAVFCLLDVDGNGEVSPADVCLLMTRPQRRDLLSALFAALSVDSGAELSAQDFSELPEDAGITIDFNTFMRLWYANNGWCGKKIES